MTGDEAASLTALMSEYAGPLCEITKTPQGYRAAIRHLPEPPAVFTAATVPALRELLEHGYDPAVLAAIMADFGGEWQVQPIAPGSAWIAVSSVDDGCTRVIAAHDLATLRSSLSRGQGEVPGRAGGERPGG
jgi:hypothetical protein